MDVMILKMGKEILTFGDIEIEKKNFFLSSKSYFFKTCRY